MTIELFRYLIVGDSIDVIAGFNDSDDVVDYINKLLENNIHTERYRVLEQDRYGVSTTMNILSFLNH